MVNLWKNKCFVVAVTVFLIACFFSVNPPVVLASTTNPIQIYVDQKLVDLPHTVEQGRILVSFDPLVKMLGASGKWDSKTATVTLEKGNTTVKLCIGSNSALVNQKQVYLDVPAKIINGQVFIPLRFTCESLGARVKWNAVNRLVNVTLSQKILRLGVQRAEFKIHSIFQRPWYDSANFFDVTHVKLVTYKPDMSLAPCLAEKWVISEDGKSITFYLVKNAKWHDGKPVTAEDVAFSVEYWKKHKLRSQGTWYSTYLEKAEKIDDYTVKLTFKEPVAGFALNGNIASTSIIPKHVWEKVSDPLAYAGDDALIGCGPFIFERYDPATQTAYLRADPNFFGGEPAIDRIEWKYFKTIDSLVMALIKGEIDAQLDYINNPPPVYAATLSSAQNVKLAEVPGIGVPYLMYFGYNQYPTNQREFREAVSYAIDYELLVDMLTAGYGEVPGRGFTPPSVPGYNPDIPKHKYDPAKAKSILDAAGFVDRDGDGYRETPQGKKLNIPINTNTENSYRVRAAEVICSQLKKVGINAYVEPLISDIASNKIYKDRDFYMVIWGISPFGVMAYSPGGYADFTDAPGLFGTCKDPELLNIVDKITHAKNLSEMKEYISKLQEYIAREIPVIALAWSDEIVPYRTDKWEGWVPLAGYGVCNYWTWLNLKPVGEI